MNLWIALFRGINVGGRHILPMKALNSRLQKIGCSDVSSYIQSGNIVFRHGETRARILGAKIIRIVNAEFGFAPEVLLLTIDQLTAALAANPFPEGESEPKTLHLFFLTEDAENVDWPALDALKNTTERFQLIDRVFYLHAPDGIGRSKLAAKVERQLGVATTARNWRTVMQVLQLATAAKS